MQAAYRTLPFKPKISDGVAKKRKLEDSKPKKKRKLAHDPRPKCVIMCIFIAMNVTVRNMALIVFDET